MVKSWNWEIVFDLSQTLYVSKICGLAARFQFFFFSLSLLSNDILIKHGYKKRIYEPVSRVYKCQSCVLSFILDRILFEKVM